MKKKNLNLIEVVVQAIMVLFVVFGNYGDILYGKTSEKMTFMTLLQGDMAGLCILFVALLICNLIICFVSYKNDSNKKDSGLHIALPIVNFFVMVIFSFFAPYNVSTPILAEFGFDYEVATSSLMTILYVLLFAIIVLSFIKRSDNALAEWQSRIKSTQAVKDVCLYRFIF